MEIRLAKLSDKPRWDQYVLNHSGGVSYQLYAWKESVEKAYGFKGYYLIAEHNNQVVGIFPLIRIRYPIISSRLVSLPYCDAGGPLADSSFIEKEIIHFALSMAEKLKIDSLVVRSCSPFASIDPQMTVSEEKVRMILALPTDSETLLRSLKAKVRSQVKKPMRDGLTAQIGGQELINEFYTVFNENMRDLGSPVHSFNWIKNIIQNYKNRAHIVVVKMPDGSPAAAGIILCSGRVVTVPWASSLRCFNRWNPNMLLYWTFLQYASDHGFEAFDFGRSTPNEGTYRFKKQWGAKPVSLHWATFSPCDNSNKDLFPEPSSSGERSGHARRLAAGIIMKMPLPVSQALGTLVRRYISL